MSSKTIKNNFPLERLFHQKPDYHFLKVFGCACFPGLRSYSLHKLDHCTRRSVFLGYSSNHEGYRCLDPTTGRVFISCHVKFGESSFPFAEPKLASTLAAHAPKDSSSFFGPAISLLPHPSSITTPPLKPLSSSLSQYLHPTLPLLLHLPLLIILLLPFLDLIFLR